MILCAECHSFMDSLFGGSAVASEGIQSVREITVKTHFGDGVYAKIGNLCNDSRWQRVFHKSPCLVSPKRRFLHVRFPFRKRKIWSHVEDWAQDAFLVNSTLFVPVKFLNDQCSFKFGTILLQKMHQLSYGCTREVAKRESSGRVTRGDSRARLLESHLL